MMSKSGGLNPRAVAGKPSVTRLTHKSCTGINASGRPKIHKKVIEIFQNNIKNLFLWNKILPRAAVKKIETTSPMLELIK